VQGNTKINARALHSNAVVSFRFIAVMFMCMNQPLRFADKYVLERFHPFTMMTLWKPRGMDDAEYLRTRPFDTAGKHIETQGSLERFKELAVMQAIFEVVRRAYLGFGGVGAPPPPFPPLMDVLEDFRSEIHSIEDLIDGVFEYDDEGDDRLCTKTFLRNGVLAQIPDGYANQVTHETLAQAMKNWYLVRGGLVGVQMRRPHSGTKYYPFVKPVDVPSMF